MLLIEVNKAHNVGVFTKIVVNILNRSDIIIFESENTITVSKVVYNTTNTNRIVQKRNKYLKSFSCNTNSLIKNIYFLLLGEILRLHMYVFLKVPVS